jgi:hypothetical protein
MFIGSKRHFTIFFQASHWWRINLYFTVLRVKWSFISDKIQAQYFKEQIGITVIIQKVPVPVLVPDSQSNPAQSPRSAAAAPVGPAATLRPAAFSQTAASIRASASSNEVSVGTIRPAVAALSSVIPLQVFLCGGGPIWPRPSSRTASETLPLTQSGLLRAGSTLGFLAGPYPCFSSTSLSSLFFSYITDSSTSAASLYPVDVM